MEFLRKDVEARVIIPTSDVVVSLKFENDCATFIQNAVSRAQSDLISTEVDRTDVVIRSSVKPNRPHLSLVGLRESGP